MTLLVSLHDVAPPHLAACARLRDRLEAAGVARATLLVVPDLHGGGETARHRPAIAWLRARLAAGDELAMHGHRHLAARAPRGAGDRLRAALLSRGEAECLAQTAIERERMLGPARRHLEDALGARLAGFVAPCWLEPAGFARHLAAADFAWHESHCGLAALGPRGTTITAPALSFSGGGRLRVAASIGVVRVAAPLSARGEVVRLALHPCDAAPRVEPIALELAARLARRHAAATVAAALRVSSSKAASRRVVSPAL